MDQQQNNTGLLTTIAGNMTDAEVERVIEDARRANTEVQISGNNGMVSQNNYNTPNGGEVEDCRKNKHRQKLRTGTVK